MINNLKFGNVWKKNFNKLLSRNNSISNNQLEFHSINTGRSLELTECIFDDLLPHSLRSTPIASIGALDNVWIATSMLSRIFETSNNLVVLDEGFPVGVIGGREILRSIIKNPTPYLFHDFMCEDIMDRKFYLDVRKAKLNKILEQMHRTQKSLIIIQNSKQSFSEISIREILEIGALCKTNIKISELPKRNVKIFRREDSVEDLFKTLIQNNDGLLMLENESLFIDYSIILEKLTGDLNYLQSVDDFLELNSSIFKFERPKLIPENLSISDVCKIMLQMKHPYVMTVDRVWTPLDILQSFSDGFVERD